ncbi:MAG TPA: GNAT family N-acetyltransferase [Ilumatobacteraceae bacterium]|nr:GNAT family N-acetyltransferase [Ilumatobacteraceae bacterium]
MPQPLLAHSIAVRRVLTQAFVDDPMFRWIFPDPDVRLDVGPLPFPELPSLPGLLGAIVGVDRQRALGQRLRAFAAARPEGSFAYLHFLPVAPDHQGHGLGKQLIQLGLDSTSSTGLGVHLETTNPTTIGFYESLGFAVTHEFRLEPDGPPAWTMWRPA